ncbi:MAG: caspase family protein [Duncaniella sp.]|nr:caspase family protein [Duncaniella sp.]
MKRLLLILLFCVMLAPIAGARTFVLVCGVSNYGDSTINLAQTTKDAKAFAKLMKTQTPDVTLLTSKYANRENILSKLRAICNRAQADDRVVFYFSGHGCENNFLASDGLVPYSNLFALLDRSAAKEKIIFIDACMAGTIVNQLKNGGKPKAKEGYAIFTSCRGNELSIESAFAGQGFFTKGLLKGMRGRGDYDSNQQVTIKELFKYVFADVVKRSDDQQHPQLIAPVGMMDKVICSWDAEPSSAK